MRFLLLLILAAGPLAAQTIPKNVQKAADGTNAITESLTFGASRTLTLSGSFAGTPTGGTLDLSALTLTLPATYPSAATVNGWFADPSTNGSFNAGAWRTDLSLVPGTNVQAYSAALDTFASNGSAYYLARANHTGTQAWSTLTSTPTTLAGYGIADAQPLDSDLTAIAALTTTAFGRGALTLADQAAAQSYFGTPANAVSAAAVLADNSLLRGDGGARGVQDSAITVNDVAANNVTLSSSTGVTLTASTTQPAVLAGNGAAGVRLQDSNNGAVYWAFSTNTGGLYPSNPYPLGSSANRVSQGFFGPSGLKIGDGTDGPTITADGTADTLTLATVASNANLNLNTHGTGGVVINTTSAIKGIRTASATLDFPSVAATGGTQDLTITVTGAATGDSVALGLPAAPAAGVTFDAWVSASNTVTVRATNATGVSVDPASASYRATVTSF